MRFDPKFFEEILNSSKTAELCEMQADAILEIAHANAPVDTGDYQRGLRVLRVRSRDRVKAIVIGEDWKTLLVESKTGNLARATRAVMRGGRR